MSAMLRLVIQSSQSQHTSPKDLPHPLGPSWPLSPLWDAPPQLAAPVFQQLAGRDTKEGLHSCPPFCPEPCPLAPRPGPQCHSRERKRLRLGFPPHADHRNTCGGRRLVTYPTAALGKDSWSQLGRPDGQADLWQVDTGPVSLQLLGRPGSPVQALLTPPTNRREMPCAQTRGQAALPQSATRGLIAGGTVAPQNKRFKLILF